MKEKKFKEYSINLDKLWNSDLNELPKWVLWDSPCIYQVTNLINHKIYIGQTTSFYNRLLGTSIFSHKISYQDFSENGGTKLLYKAFKKYGLINFVVEIIDEPSSEISLDELESQWIRELNSCILDPTSHGYNMNFGGTNCDHLFTEEVREFAEARRVEMMSKYNQELYGEDADCTTHMQDPEIQRYAHQRLHQVLLEKNRLLYGEDATCSSHLHTPEVEWQTLSARIFKSLEKTFKWYYDEGATKVTPEVFWNWSENSNIYYHLANTIKHLNQLRLDLRWTDEYESVYGFYSQFYNSDSCSMDVNRIRDYFNSNN